MTKDVLLSIKGLQIGENEQNDTIEVISPGDYYFRNGKHFFMYEEVMDCLLYTSPSPRDISGSRMPSSA